MLVAVKGSAVTTLLGGTVCCPELRGGLADFVGGLEDASDGNEAREIVGSNGSKAHRGETSALRAIGIAAELTRSDFCAEIG